MVVSCKCAILTLLIAMLCVCVAMAVVDGCWCVQCALNDRPLYSYTLCVLNIWCNEMDLASKNFGYDRHKIASFQCFINKKKMMKKKMMPNKPMIESHQVYCSLLIYFFFFFIFFSFSIINKYKVSNSSRWAMDIVCHW